MTINFFLLKIQRKTGMAKDDRSDAECVTISMPTDHDVDSKSSLFVKWIIALVFAFQVACATLCCYAMVIAIPTLDF